jgi:hypothetical protein
MSHPYHYRRIESYPLTSPPICQHTPIRKNRRERTTVNGATTTISITTTTQAKTSKNTATKQDTQPIKTAIRRIPSGVTITVVPKVRVLRTVVPEDGVCNVETRRTYVVFTSSFKF